MTPLQCFSVQHHSARTIPCRPVPKLFNSIHSISIYAEPQGAITIDDKRACLRIVVPFPIRTHYIKNFVRFTSSMPSYRNSPNHFAVRAPVRFDVLHAGRINKPEILSRYWMSPTSARKIRMRPTMPISKAPSHHVLLIANEFGHGNASERDRHRANVVSCHERCRRYNTPWPASKIFLTEYINLIKPPLRATGYNLLWFNKSKRGRILSVAELHHNWWLAVLGYWACIGSHFTCIVCCNAIKKFIWSIIQRVQLRCRENDG